jgi:hypothetical protein
MLLFDETKALEKTLGEEAARAIVQFVEKQAKDPDGKASFMDITLLQRDIKEAESRTAVKIEEVKAMIAASKAETIKWLAGMLIAQSGIIAALVKLA